MDNRRTLLEDPKVAIFEDDKRVFAMDSMSDYSIYNRDDPQRKEAQSVIFDDGKADLALIRGLGCVLGLACGDALGSPLEFSPVRYNSDELKGMPDECWEGKGYNRFRLKPGQWTDDTAMSLCLADSLIEKAGFDPADLRLRFHCWWTYGYNNAFGQDRERPKKTSVGLGGNISQSMAEFEKHPTRARTKAGDTNTSGNGSIMRLGPCAVYFYKDHEKALEVAKEQSLTTHQGTEAAECCRLLAHIIVSCIRSPHSDPEAIKEAVLGDLTGQEADEDDDSEENDGKEKKKGKGKEKEKEKEEKEKEEKEKEEKEKDKDKNKDRRTTRSRRRGAGGLPHFSSDLNSIRCLASSKAELDKEGNPDPNRNWNWKSGRFRYALERVDEHPGYVGSYAMDALAMALHCVWTTGSFEKALLKCANLRGDADSVAAVCGQIAGSIYGVRAIPPSWIKCIQQWDRGGDIALRGYKLFHHSPTTTEDEKPSKRSR